MKTVKFNSPKLFVDDHHGKYMMQFAWEQLAERYKAQAKKVLSQDEIEDLTDCEKEFHYDACDRLTQVTFKTPTGQKWNLQYSEGGIWAIPYCFKGKKREDFFGA